MVAPPWFTVPPEGYGGIERVIATLADGLAARGHEVTLFAPRGSRTQATLVETTEPMFRFIGSGAVEAQVTLEAYRHRDKFDLVHDHTVAGLAVSPFVPTPVVHTVHGAVLDDIRGLYACLPSNVRLVAISESQRRTLPPGASSTLIHNSVVVEEHSFCERPDDYLLFVGRSAPQKGPLEAIRIAQRAGHRLLMLLKVNEPAEEEYFEFMRREIEQNGVQVELRSSEERKREAFARASATLFPISWEEPFGLVMIESMAGGTPVIGFDRGSVSEVVEDGLTGFVCANIDEAVEAVPRVQDLSRRACRERVETLFSSARALDRHEELYHALVRGNERAR